MDNEQGKAYLIRMGVLRPRAAKWKRQRQYGYVAECWHRHLINCEAKARIDAEPSIRGEIAIETRRVKMEHSDPTLMNRYAELIGKGSGWTIDEFNEAADLAVRILG